MLLLALACPYELDIFGITTVAGNVPLKLTQCNARLICELAGRADVPVYAGCERPLKRELVTAEYVHGRSGIDGIEIHEPRIPLQSQHAVDYIHRHLEGGGCRFHYPWDSHYPGLLGANPLFSYSLRPQAYSTRRNAVTSLFSSAVSCTPKIRVKNSTVSSKVGRRPSWKCGGESLIPRREKVLAQPSARPG